MKNFYTTIILLFLSLSLFSQNPLACDGQRYIDDVFTDVSVTTVTYGSNTTFFGTTQNLQMDIYEPVGDIHDKRPVIILAAGGSFLLADRTSMSNYCEQFARKGYVAVTIDYRAGFFGTSEEIIAGAVMRAVSDMKAAVRYFRMDEDANDIYKINPDYILVGGYSAGSITALHVAYLDEMDDINSPVQTAIDDNGGFEGNTGSVENQSYSSEVFAVYNLSGALQKKEYIDAAEMESLVSYHGTADNTVPSESGVANGLAQVDGSVLLHQEAEVHGIPNYLKVVEGGGHGDIHSDAFYGDELAEFNLFSSIFLQNQMCPDFQVTNTDDIATIQQSIDVFPNPSDNVIQFNFGKLESAYQVKVFDQLGRLVSSFNGENKTQFNLQKRNIGQGVFFVNVLFEDTTVAPLTERIVFN